MAATIRHASVGVFLISFSYIFLGSYQQGSPQNIETFYPSAAPPSPVHLPPPPPSPVVVPTPSSPPSLPPPPKRSGSPSSENKTVVKAVIGTAAGSIAISALLFVLVRRHSRKKLEEKSKGGLPVLLRDDFARFDRNIKGLIVDENGLDVLYWRNLRSGKARNGFRREVMQGHEEGGRDGMTAVTNGSRHSMSEPIQEVPLLGEKSATNSNQIQPLRDVEMSLSSSSPEPGVLTASAIPGVKSEPPSPPSPLPPPLPAPKASNARPFPPPPPLNGGGSVPAAPKVPPPPPKGKPSEQSGTDHSMVWNKIGHGSFK